MPDSAGTRSAGRLHPRNWAPSLEQAFLVLLSVAAFLGASAVIYGTPWAASANKPQCNNRRDDDGDGKIDYPADPGCKGRGDKSEVDLVEPPPPPPPLSPPPPPPPPAGYFVSDFETHDFRYPWSTLFHYDCPGFTDLTPGPSTGPASGRVRVVPDPADPAGGNDVARFEIRDSDPTWCNGGPLDKSEVRTLTAQTWDRAGGAVLGDVRWFHTRMYLPYNATEKFEWPLSGTSNTFISILGLHPAASGQWPSWEIGGYWGQTNQWFELEVQGGPFPGAGGDTYNLFQLTDGSGNRLNHNRWIDLVLGFRMAPDTTGWVEAWVDGVNVLPRTSHATMWTGDYASFYKQGVYENGDSILPTGSSVIYYDDTSISYTKP
jgi:Polysaccharide lyase